MARNEAGGAQNRHCFLPVTVNPRLLTGVQNINAPNW
jgi:hypothetical protein